MLTETKLTDARQIAQQRKPWIIVLTETKLTDARQDGVFLQEYLPEYTLYNSLFVAFVDHVDNQQGLTVAYRLQCIVDMGGIWRTGKPARKVRPLLCDGVLRTGKDLGLARQAHLCLCRL